MHGMTLLIITTDLLLNRIEFVFTHLCYTLPVSVIYVIVNGVYCKIAGGHIYEGPSARPKSSQPARDSRREAFAHRGVMAVLCCCLLCRQCCSGTMLTVW